MITRPSPQPMATLSATPLPQPIDTCASRRLRDRAAIAAAGAVLVAVAATARAAPPDVQAGIDRYLAALEAREGRYRTRTVAYVEAGAGYDSNANAGVAQADIGLPVLGPVTVADVGVRQASAFGWLAAAGRIDHPVAPGWSVNGSGYASGTFYADASEFNLASFGAALGGSYNAKGNLYALSYAHSEILL